MDWDQIEFFTKEEMDCKHTGNNEMELSFMLMLDAIRRVLNRPLIVTSGYRDPSHPVEASKSKPGEHTLGLAADIGIYGADALRLIEVATRRGVPRIGIKQNGPVSGRFIHLGMATQQQGFNSPWLWSY